jgi:glycosyltransferase involved in cell wall biosynthesis
MTLAELLAALVDPGWYRASYPDVQALGADPAAHFVQFGLADGRNPNGFFHRSWYAETYPDAAASGLSPLLHYLSHGMAAGYDPHPRFDAAWYVRQHPEAADNPLLFHVQTGQARGWKTEPATDVADYLPATADPLPAPAGVAVDVVIPVAGDLPALRRCLRSLRADPSRPPGRIIVVDDASPDAELAAWIDAEAAARRIERLRNRVPAGFWAAANRGITAAGTHDVLLLDPAVRLPAGAVGRLAAQAHAAPDIASVSPLRPGTGTDAVPTDAAGALPAGLDAAALDALCQGVNAGRAAEVPEAVSGCVYLRRAALRDGGPFGADSAALATFSARVATLGWRHVLACDVLAGGIAATEPPRCNALAARRSRHAVADPSGPARFALTAAAFRQSGQPVILLVFHGLGGGAQHQMMTLVRRFGGQAQFLLLFATPEGVALTAPALGGHPTFIASPDRVEDLVRVLRSAGTSRVHIHHLKGLDYDVRALVLRLGVPFDVTVHDYFALCPQVNLLPWPDAPYCGEPGPAGCNACIAARPADGAADILAWRAERSWQFLDADRVFCPSEDVRRRLARYGLAGKAVVAPHEPVPAGPWPLRPPAWRGGKLRIALLGVLANLKGAVAVGAVAALAPAAPAPAALAAADLELHVIGPMEGDVPDSLRNRVHCTGRYAEADLPRLLARIRPHAVWFPSPCPETYGYTLSAAIAAGLPIVAADIGSYPERLAGRPLTWLVDPRAPPEGWIAAFAAVRQALAAGWHDRVPDRPPVADLYGSAYLAPKRLTRRRPPERRRVLVLPDRRDGGLPTAAAYTRLLLPLDHLAATLPLDVMLGDLDTALRSGADAIVTHPAAVADPAAAAALDRHAARTGTLLVCDLTADPAGARSPALRRLLRRTDGITVPSQDLVRHLAAQHPGKPLWLPDALDERLWCAAPLPPESHAGLVRILLPIDGLGDPRLGDSDLGCLLPALVRLRQQFGGWVTLAHLAADPVAGLPPWLPPVALPAPASASYPGLVHWMTAERRWDIILAPASSGHTLLAGAALGAAVVSATAPDGPDGWYASIEWLIRNPALRARQAAAAHRALLEQGTLGAQQAVRRRLWADLLGLDQPASAAPKTPNGERESAGNRPKGRGRAAAEPAGSGRRKG